MSVSWCLEFRGGWSMVHQPELQRAEMVGVSEQLGLPPLSWDEVAVCLNSYTSRWASYCDTGGAVASCTPCVFLSISANLNPSLNTFLNTFLNSCPQNLINVNSVNHLCAFWVADLFSFFECISPDNAQCWVGWRILGETNEALSRCIVHDGLIERWRWSWWCWRSRYRCCGLWCWGWSWHCWRVAGWGHMCQFLLFSCCSSLFWRRWHVARMKIAGDA